jgi:hypothetical protein
MSFIQLSTALAEPPPGDPGELLELVRYNFIEAIAGFWNQSVNFICSLRIG